MLLKPPRKDLASPGQGTRRKHSEPAAGEHARLRGRARAHGPPRPQPRIGNCRGGAGRGGAPVRAVETMSAERMVCVEAQRGERGRRVFRLTRRIVPVCPRTGGVVRGRLVVRVHLTSSSTRTQVRARGVRGSGRTQRAAARAQSTGTAAGSWPTPRAPAPRAAPCPGRRLVSPWAFFARRTLQARSRERVRVCGARGRRARGAASACSICASRWLPALRSRPPALGARAGAAGSAARVDAARRPPSPLRVHVPGPC